ncbi:MAG: methyltransferase domain-containing protein [Gaiellaceae bacterium]
MLDAVQVSAEGIAGFLQLAGDERVLATGVAGLGDGEVTFDGDLTTLPYDRGSFDCAVSVDKLHRVRRPELAVAELARVTRLGGRILVVDRIAPIDPLTAIEVDRAERERDPEHARLLPEADMRGLFDANGLVLLRSQSDGDVGWYLLRR